MPVKIAVVFVDAFTFHPRFLRSAPQKVSFEPAIAVVEHRCSKSFAEMKNTLKECLCWGFVTTVSEPTCIKTLFTCHTPGGRENKMKPPLSVCVCMCVVSACDGWCSGTVPCCPGDCF